MNDFPLAGSSCVQEERQGLFVYESRLVYKTG